MQVGYPQYSFRLETKEHKVKVKIIQEKPHQP